MAIHALIVRIPRGCWQVALALALGLSATAVHAQSVSMTAEACLGGYYKPDAWLPISIQLDNQGQTADVEVSAQLQEYGAEPTEYRLPVEQLPAPSRRRYTLYVLPPRSFSSRPLELQLLQGRRIVGTQQLSLRPINSGERMVAVLGSEQGSLALIDGMPLRVARPPPTSPYGYNGGPTPGSQAIGRALVSYLHPEQCPDHLQGFDAVDLLVIGAVSAGELSPSQQNAIRQWVRTGGTVVIAAGATAARLNDPFFRDLLPVRLNGTVSIPRLVGMQNFTLKQAPATGSFVIAAASPKPEARVWATADGDRLPLVVEGREGAGHVFFMAFDTATPPFRVWVGGATDVWRKLLEEATSGSSVLEQLDSPGLAGWNGPSRGGAVGNACHELAQMDPPRFLTIGLFLFAYILFLVPVNYFVLKQRDKKEYAWLTTPVIVLVFSLIAYFIGFGMKGGRVLLAKVGVVEAAAGSPVGAAEHFLGIFSPRKTRYDVAALDAGVTLADWRGEAGGGYPARGSSPEAGRPMSFVESDSFRAEAMSVDMWSMRILRAESAVPLGQGVSATLSRGGATGSGRVMNQTPYPLMDCHLVMGDQSVALGDLAPGESRPVPPLPPRNGAYRSILPTSILTSVRGDAPVDRMKRAILQPLTTYDPSASAGNEPRLIAWITQPLVRITVDGHPVQEQNVSLLVVHLR